MLNDKTGAILPQKIIPLTQIRPVSAIGTGVSDIGASQIPFADALSQAMQDLVTTKKDAEQDAYDLIMGGEEDLHSIMIRNAIATTSVETAVELTSRAVMAYKEIMQMQV